MSSESNQSAAPRWREFFLLEKRIEAARRDAFRSADPGWAEFLLGRTVLTDANQLAQASDCVSSALLLCRSAVVTLAAAHRARPARPIATPEEREPPLRLPPAQVALGELPSEQRTLVQEVLEANPCELHLAKLSDAQRKLALQGMQAVARHLAEPLEAEASRAARVTRQRWLRAGLASGMILLLVWLGVKLWGPKNLALHKTVQVSSNYSKQKYPPKGLVDGSRGGVGVHTNCDVDQWVMIDLGTIETIHEVDVYNRTDCCQERAAPLRLELSTDGTRFVAVDRAPLAFDVWEAALKPQPARYIRLSNERADCIHLAEVEVY